ncbi:MAG: hypothetical protein RLZZ127_1935 [Planctomycetota bacterium]|jgi:hypothetical protein
MRFLCPTLLLAAAVPAVEYHVSPTGSDAAAGSLAAPLATIAKGLSLAQAGDTVWLHSGTYREVVRPVRNGSATAPITIAAWVSGGATAAVTVSAYDPVQAAWTLHHGRIWKAALATASGPAAAGAATARMDRAALVPARWPDGVGPVDFDRERKAEAATAAIEPGPVDAQGRALVTYRHAGFAGQPAGAWDGAIVDLAVGYQWSIHSATVAASADGSISFRYDTQTPKYGNRFLPAAGDRFFLTGHLRALDRTGEFHWDAEGRSGPAATLYVWSDDPAGPAAHTVELGRRNETINTSDRSWIVIRDITAIGGRLLTNAASTDSRFERVRLTDDRGRTATGINAVQLAGTRHAVVDCDIADTWGMGIGSSPGSATPADMVIRNTVVLGAMQNGITLTRSLRAIVETCTVGRTGAHGIDFGTVGGRVSGCHVYANGMAATDLALLNAIGAGDLAGTEVAWNWLHDTRATYGVLGASGIPFNGGKGIRIDCGDFGGPGISDVVIHRNLVTGTTHGGIRLWGLQPGQANRGAAGTLVAHNAVPYDDISFAGTASGAFGGYRIRGNIAARIGSASSDGAADAAVPAGGEILGNRFIAAAPAGNDSGDPGWRDPGNGDWRLAVGAAAIDAALPTAPWTDGVAGAAPDQGPYETSAALRSYGAAVLPSQMAALRVHIEGGSVVVCGFPAGRGLPADAALTAGGIACTRSGLAYDLATDRTTVRWTPAAAIPPAGPFVLSRGGRTWTLSRVNGAPELLRGPVAAPSTVTIP